MARSKILRVTLAVASVAIIAIAAVTLSTRQREPEFIDRFKGRIVSDNVDRYLLSPGKGEPRVRHYVFTASYEALSEAMRKELTARGWTAERTLRLFSGDSPSSAVPHGWLFSKGNDQYSIAPDVGMSSDTLEVTYVYEPNWLEQQFAAVKGWFGNS